MPSSKRIQDILFPSIVVLCGIYYACTHTNFFNHLIRCPLFHIACKADQFQCLNGACIDLRLRCNRQYDCSDGSDEENCPTAPPPTQTEPPYPGITCSPGQRPCSSGRQCVRFNQFCDGRVDCYDLSDESHCGKYEGKRIAYMHE